MGTDLERRKLLLGLGAAGITVACGPTIIFQSEPRRTPENLSSKPQLGDVIVDGEGEYLLRSNIAMRTPPGYWEKSKGDRFGRKRFSNLPNYVREDIFDRFPKREKIEVYDDVIDQFSGQLRKGMPNGGEMIVCFGGAWTSRGFPLDGVLTFDKDPFWKIRERLTRKNWQLYNYNFFTYEAYGLKEYRARDTLRPIADNVRAAISFMSSLERYFPFVQFHVVAHSLGGIFALEAVKRHMDIVNSLTLIDVPFGGLDTLVKEVQEALEKIGISIRDNPAIYLEEIYKDPNNQKDLDKFGGGLTGRGRKLNVVKSENDNITRNSNNIKGSRLTVIKGGGHGKGLEESLVHDVIEETAGPNLAA